MLEKLEENCKQNSDIDDQSVSNPEEDTNLGVEMTKEVAKEAIKNAYRATRSLEKVSQMADLADAFDVLGISDLAELVAWAKLPENRTFFGWGHGVSQSIGHTGNGDYTNYDFKNQGGDHWTQNPIYKAINKKKNRNKPIIENRSN